MSTIGLSAVSMSCRRFVLASASRRRRPPSRASRRAATPRCRSPSRPRRAEERRRSRRAAGRFPSEEPDPEGRGRAGRGQEAPPEPPAVRCARRAHRRASLRGAPMRTRARAHRDRCRHPLANRRRSGGPLLRVTGPLKPNLSLPAVGMAAAAARLVAILRLCRRAELAAEFFTVAPDISLVAFAPAVIASHGISFQESKAAISLPSRRCRVSFAVLSCAPFRRGAVAQFGRARESHSRGRRFDPGQLHQDFPRRRLFRVAAWIEPATAGDRGTPCAPRLRRRRETGRRAKRARPVRSRSAPPHVASLARDPATPPARGSAGCGPRPRA